MPVLKVLDQEGKEVENAEIQDGAQVNVIEKITINGGTTYITVDQDGEDKNVVIDISKLENEISNLQNQIESSETSIAQIQKEIGERDEYFPESLWDALVQQEGDMSKLETRITTIENSKASPEDIEGVFSNA
jgi:chaperonin cofactor prefoldin